MISCGIFQAQGSEDLRDGVGVEMGNPRSPNSVTQKWKTQLLANKEASTTTEGRGSHLQQEDQSGFCEGRLHSGISQPPHTQLLGPSTIVVF